MWWTSYLPDAPDTLSKLEWRLWIIAAIVTISGVLIGLAARQVGRYRATMLEQHLASALEERDAKAKQLEQMAIEAKQEATAVKERQQPRRLTPDQRTTLLKLLSAGRGTAVKITAMLGDGESKGFAEAIKSVLSEAGWIVDGVNQGLFTGQPIGLHIQVKDGTAPPPNTHLLGNSLIQIGILTTGAIKADLPPNAIEVIVGHKPQ